MIKIPGTGGGFGANGSEGGGDGTFGELISSDMFVCVYRRVVRQ